MHASPLSTSTATTECSSSRIVLFRDISAVWSAALRVLCGLSAVVMCCVVSLLF
ncbi:unnamed protein product [Ectocarpus sp. CCAP 1310/34]|nr:unnamed protein product [Ectocarpus sp. CCAP 1310/34]